MFVVLFRIDGRCVVVKLFICTVSLSEIKLHSLFIFRMENQQELMYCFAYPERRLRRRFIFSFDTSNCRVGIGLFINNNISQVIRTPYITFYYGNNYVIYREFGNELTNFNSNLQIAVLTCMCEFGRNEKWLPLNEFALHKLIPFPIIGRYKFFINRINKI